jgi:RNA polymerase sigma-70 factor, ECF subfamily
VAVKPRDLERLGRDRGLVEAHCSGDSDVFAIIVKEHYGRLLAQAQRRLGSRAEAEDAVQDAFEKAFRALPSFGGEYRLGAWLSTIVANVCADHGARRIVEHHLPERFASRVPAPPDVSEGVSDPAVLQAVEAAIAALPATRRAAFLLYEVWGFSYGQVAEQLGITRDNARARVHRAKADLRKALSDTRSTLAALITMHLGARRLARWIGGSPQEARARASAHAPLRPVGEPFPGAVTPSSPTLPATAGQMAASPIAQAAASVASAGPRTNAMVWLASLATAITSTFSGPAAAAVPVAAAVASVVSPSTSVAAPPPDPGTSTPAPTVSADRDRQATPVAETPAWVVAAAADDAGSPAPTPTIGSGPVAAPTPCPWSADGLGGPAGPISGAVVAMLSTPAVNLDSSSNLELAVTTSLAVSGAAYATIPVLVHARACLLPLQQSILAVDVAGPGGAVQLRASLLRTVSDASGTRYIFRGVVADAAGGPSWGLPDRFVALLDVQPSANTVSLSVAFLGTPLSIPASSPTTTTTTTTNTTTTTTNTTTTSSTLPSTTTTSLASPSPLPPLSPPSSPAR